MRPRCVRVFVCVKSFYHRNRCWPWFHFQIIFQSPNNRNLYIQQNMVVCIGEWKKKRACVQHTLEISSHSLFFSLLSPNRNALKSHHFHQNIAINKPIGCMYEWAECVNELREIFSQFHMQSCAPEGFNLRISILFGGWLAKGGLTEPII